MEGGSDTVYGSVQKISIYIYDWKLTDWLKNRRMLALYGLYLADKYSNPKSRNFPDLAARFPLL